MTYIPNRDFLLEVAKGNVPRHSILHKFGYNPAVSTTLVGVTPGGVYQTPIAAVSLEFVSSSADDALDSTGMHEITIVGLDAAWAEQTVTVAAHATDGTIAVAIPGTWLRVYSAFVSVAGAYASTTVPSHLGTITIRIAAAGATYAILPLVVAGFGFGETLIGAYTVPTGVTAYILANTFSSDLSGTKTADFYFFKRENVDDVVTPFAGTLRVQEIYAGTQALHAFEHISQESYPARTDIGFLTLASAATKASISFELLLVED